MTYVIELLVLSIVRYFCAAQKQKGVADVMIEAARAFSDVPLPQEIRRIMYTTNTIENLHRQLRKVTKTTTIFLHEEALLKLLWLAQHDITRRWTMRIHNWGTVIAQFAILHPDRIQLA